MNLRRRALCQLLTGSVVLGVGAAQAAVPEAGQTVQGGVKRGPGSKAVTGGVNQGGGGGTKKMTTTSTRMTRTRKRPSTKRMSRVRMSPVTATNPPL